MDPIVLKMFCTLASGQADRPGVSIKQAQFQGVPAVAAQGTQAAIPSPNSGLIKDGANGVFALNMANVTPELLAKLSEGKAYTITITETTV